MPVLDLSPIEIRDRVIKLIAGMKYAYNGTSDDGEKIDFNLIAYTYIDSLSRLAMNFAYIHVSISINFVFIYLIIFPKYYSPIQLISRGCRKYIRMEL